MTGISVVVCCYNSAGRIKPTLEHLLMQQHIANNKWEVVLVDNASTDNTAEIAYELYSGYSGLKPSFKIVVEGEPGLSSARIRGIKEAAYAFVLFCDDDNWLGPNYVYKSLRFMENNKDAGILGGMGEPVFEGKTPPYFWENQYHTLAVGPQYREKGDITNTRKVVYGAGMTLNKECFYTLLRDYEFDFQASDRIGNSLVSGGDHELCLAVRKIGYKIYWSDELTFKHYMPANRTTISYYKRLFTGLGLSEPMLIGYSLNQNDINGVKYRYEYLALRYLKNIVVCFIKLMCSGYFFSNNKYKYINYLQPLYRNYGSLIITLKRKNYYRDRFIQTKLFLSTKGLH